MTSTAHPDALPEGYRVQEYEFLSVLGVGGFGITYLARDTLLDRKVAIKEYLPRDFAVRTEDHSVRSRSSTESESYAWGLERFLDEARTLASLDHPSIIRIHKYFEAHGSGYIVMEYIEGETLDERLKHQNTLNESQLMNILNPLVQGLEQVHAAGYLHRDITPKNILLRKDGSPVLIDFGSARQELGVRSRSVTSVVTPGYAPLEQYSTRGKQQGPWTDVYGLSAVAYRCITGTVPKDATERAQEEALTPALKLAKGQYTEGLLTAVDRGMVVKIEERPQNLKVWCSLWVQRKKQQSTVANTKVKGSGQEGASNVHSGANGSVWKNKKALVAFVTGIAVLLVVVLYTFQVEQVKKEKEAVQRVAEIKAQAEREEAERKAAEERAAARKAAEIKAQAEKEGAKRKAAEERAVAARKAFEQGKFASGKRDYAEAFKWYWRAAKLDHVKAQYTLGWMYRNGQGVPYDSVEAVKWYRRAAEQGDTKAQNDLGEMYEAGHGMAKSLTEAINWYWRAAERGLAEAQLNLGRMYKQGRGTIRSYTEAVKWFRRAAEQGDVRAQSSLGWMYKEGEGVLQDDAEAFKWWQWAAEQGAADAQDNLGVMYDEGRGVAQNYVEAHKWSNLASTSPEAGFWAKVRCDKIAKKMTREELATAQRLAREWQPKTWDQLKAE